MEIYKIYYGYMRDIANSYSDKTLAVAIHKVNKVVKVIKMIENEKSKRS